MNINYSQNDPRWKNVLLGFNTSKRWTIGTSGCFITAIADVCNWAGKKYTPLDINNICKEHKWFRNGGMLTRSDIPALLCSNLEYKGRKNWSTATPMSYFKDINEPDVIYIIEIDSSPSPGIQTHFVMVWETHGKDDLIIDDSWDGKRKPLSSYGKPSAIIYSAMKFIRKKEKPSEPTPKPKPKKDKPPKKTTPPAKPPVTEPEKPTEPPAKDEAPKTPDNPPVTQSPDTPVETPVEIEPGVQTWVKQDTPTPTPQVSWLTKLFQLLLKLLSKFLKKGK